MKIFNCFRENKSAYNDDKFELELFARILNNKFISLFDKNDDFNHFVDVHSEVKVDQIAYAFGIGWDPAPDLVCRNIDEIEFDVLDEYHHFLKLMSLNEIVELIRNKLFLPVEEAQKKIGFLDCIDLSPYDCHNMTTGKFRFQCALGSTCVTREDMLTHIMGIHFKCYYY